MIDRVVDFLAAAFQLIGASDRVAEGFAIAILSGLVLALALTGLGKVIPPLGRRISTVTGQQFESFYTQRKLSQRSAQFAQLSSLRCVILGGCWGLLYAAVPGGMLGLILSSVSICLASLYLMLGWFHVRAGLLGEAERQQQAIAAELEAKAEQERMYAELTSQLAAMNAEIKEHFRKQSLVEEERPDGRK